MGEWKASIIGPYLPEEDCYCDHRVCVHLSLLYALLTRHSCSQEKQAHLSASCLSPSKPARDLLTSSSQPASG